MIVPILYLVFNIKSVNADLHDVAIYFVPFFVWHTARDELAHARARASRHVRRLPADRRAAGSSRRSWSACRSRKGTSSRVTAKGGDRNRRFVEWPLLRFYGALLALTDLVDRLCLSCQHSRRRHRIRRAGFVLELVQSDHSDDRLFRLRRTAQAPQSRALRNERARDAHRPTARTICAN